MCDDNKWDDEKKTKKTVVHSRYLLITFAAVLSAPKRDTWYFAQ